MKLIVEALPTEVDAGAELSVTARLACTADWHPEGSRVALSDSHGTDVGSISLAPAPPDDGPGPDGAPLWYGTAIVAAPTLPGDHRLLATLTAGEGDGVIAHAETSVRVTAHASVVSAWGIPATIVAGQELRMTVGVKCSCGCNLGGRPYRILDEDGHQVAAGRLRETVWPDTSALYFDEVLAPAPSRTGRHDWTLEVPEWTGSPLPHAAAQGSCSVNIVPTPDCGVTMRVVDGDSGDAIEGMHVRLHPYRAHTDGSGQARIVLPRGRYALSISGFQYTAYQDVIEVDRDLAFQTEMFIHPEDRPYAPRREVREARFSTLAMQTS